MNKLDLGEYEYEPVPGLPQRLPQGERILWQGAPDWQTLARIPCLETRRVLRRVAHLARHIGIS